jgi:hypothetical protein
MYLEIENEHNRLEGRYKTRGDQLLDAFQQALEPISTLYTGDFGVGRARSCPPIEYVSSNDKRNIKDGDSQYADFPLNNLSYYLERGGSVVD